MVGAHSGSNWLDRLRSNKGLPTSENLDLDHFLRAHENDLPSSSPATEVSSSRNSNSYSTRSLSGHDRFPSPNREISGEKNGDGEWVGVVSDVLSELFNMGDPDGASRLSGKKSFRKQTNPKCCVFSSTRSQKYENVGAAMATSLDSRSNSKGTRGQNNVNVDCHEVEEEEQEEEEVEEEREELKGYSRNEVTVIDTSCEVWKFEKMVFRRNNVWKVRNKKGKPRSVWGKKRKNSGSEFHANLAAKKKSRVFSDKEANHDEKSEDGSKEILDDLSQTHKKRIPFSRSHKKPGKNGSSVIMVKGIPTNEKSGANLSKSHPEDAQKENKA
ncbi:uncharacterized protein LOC120003229 isoform X2 [Tripterygium wilfordii]|uniref:uncharacterized protein LOC120003229 isoform X2 n=1 Tax=Tripterygium wilfordii TaxID=458696 RepID=UPI0018F8568D|nr:uncharacterized protein LOC120003229 isoform X2 [Tripterygium wilfordii]